MDHLTEILFRFSDEREVIILGENDYREIEDHDADCSGCNRCFPGLHGARRTAEQLAENLGRTVYWALCPDRAKDVRDWLATVSGSGSGFLQKLQPVQVTPQIPLEKPPEDSRVTVTLKEYRTQIVDLRVPTVGKPGVYIDTSPTGAGKSYSDIAAIKKTQELGTRVLLVEPTHKACKERVEELDQNGVNAVAYPVRSIKNCTQTFECERAEKMGLSAINAVCASCDQFKPDLVNGENSCFQSWNYRGAVAEAQEAAVTVMTHSRAAIQGLASVSEDRSYISIHEDPIPILRPMQEATLCSMRHLDQFLEAIQNMPLEKMGYRWQHDAYRDTVDLIASVVVFLEHIMKTLDRAAKEVVIPPEFRKAVLRNFERITFELVEPAGYSGREESLAAFRVVIGIVTGRWTTLAVMLSEKFQKGQQGKQVTSPVLVCVQDNTPNPSATTWLSDATGDVELLKHIISGVSVFDMTPQLKL
ncbi:hypothetical protein OAK91_07620, partial [Planctomycetaceae bacterium]|nr:hypothetical protein [Planctomycetaceae bacterium]